MPSSPWRGRPGRPKAVEELGVTGLKRGEAGLRRSCESIRREATLMGDGRRVSGARMVWKVGVRVWVWVWV